jgi:hypothetical protein
LQVGYIKTILSEAKINATPYTQPGEKTSQTGVYLTTAFQLVGAYDDLDRCRKNLGTNVKLISIYSKEKSKSDGPRPYANWESHHIFEYNDLVRLGKAEIFPKYEKQLCVLLPKTAHQKRVSGILRSQNPSRELPTVEDLRRAYKLSYETIGNYTGAGEAAIRKELMGIVEAVFLFAGL